VPRPQVPCAGSAWRAGRGCLPTSDNPELLGRPRRTRTSDEATRTGIRLLFRFQGAHRSPLPRRVASDSQKVASSPRLAFSPARSAANRRFPSAGVGDHVNRQERRPQPPPRSRRRRSARAGSRGAAAWIPASAGTTIERLRGRPGSGGARGGRAATAGSDRRSASPDPRGSAPLGCGSPRRPTGPAAGGRRRATSTGPTPPAVPPGPPARPDRHPRHGSPRRSPPGRRASRR